MAGSPSLPDAKHLLELLKRAAEELKASQRETAAARNELEGITALLTRTEAELAAERRKVTELLQSRTDPSTPIAPRAIPIKTMPMAKGPQLVEGTEQLAALEPSDKTNVSGSDAELLEKRMGGLQDELAVVEADRRALKERLKELETQLASGEGVRSSDSEQARRLSQTEHELAAVREQLIVEQARGADYVTRLHAWEARANELEASLNHLRDSSGAEHQQAEAMTGQLAAAEAELETLRARSQALEGQVHALEADAASGQQKLNEAAGRVAQLEADLAGIRGRRDELNVEIGHVEKERNALKARVQELEGAADAIRAEEAKLRADLEAATHSAIEAEGAKRAEAEAAAAKERERHQATAQKLIEARGRVRELEGQVEQGAQRVKALEDAAAATAAEHLKALEAQRLANEAASAELVKRVAELEQQLAHANDEWRHTDKQYEQLHKEMIVVLDQRDEARRELDAIKTRLGITQP